MLNDSVEYLMFKWMPIEIYNVEIEEYQQTGLLKQITRSISRALFFCIQFSREIGDVPVDVEKLR